MYSFLVPIKPLNLFRLEISCKPYIMIWSKDQSKVESLQAFIEKFFIR